MTSTIVPSSGVNTPAPSPVSEATFIALLDEIHQRLNAAEGRIDVLVAEIDEMKAA